MKLVNFVSELWDSFWSGGKKAEKKMSVADLILIAEYRVAVVVGEIPTHLKIPITATEQEVLAILKRRQVVKA